MGGSDQWGNIINGVELGRRMGTPQLHALTTPLLTTASGAKMGKTANGAVWLNANMLSPYDYWQFWRNTEDADVGRFLKLFTLLPMERIAELERGPVNEAKKVLATEATALIHGREAADQAAETARKAFEEGTLGGADLHTVEKPRGEVIGLGILQASTLLGLSASNGEARRLVQGNGLRVNGVAVSDASATLGEADISPEGIIAFSAGKKKHALLKVV